MGRSEPGLGSVHWSRLGKAYFKGGITEGPVVTQGAVIAELLPLLGPNGQGEGTTFRTGKNVQIWLSDGEPYCRSAAESERNTQIGERIRSQACLG